MMVRELCPAVADRFQFSFRYQKRVPNRSGCYALTTFEGKILYVGLSCDLNRRFGEHRNNCEKCDPTILGKACRQRLQLHHPAPALGNGGNGLTLEFHRHFFAVTRRAPDRHGNLLLQYCAIAE